MFKAITVYDKITNLNKINEIDEMLITGVPMADIVDFIQVGLERLVDTSAAGMYKALTKRKKILIKQQENACMASEDQDINSSNTEVDGVGLGRSIRPRTPNNMAKVKYFDLRKRMDAAIEFECLYLSQRDRISALMEQENYAGAPYDNMYREFREARQTLKDYAEITEPFNAKGSELTLNLTFEQYSQNTRDILSNAESRRRIVSVIERIRKVSGGKDISGYLDGEYEEIEKDKEETETEAVQDL